MPNVFSLPLARPIWNSVASKPTDFVNLLPSPKFDSIKSKINAITQQTTTIQNKLNAQENNTFVPTKLSADQVNAYNKLLSDKSKLQKSDQILFDNLVQEMYIKSLDADESNVTSFSDWYLNNLTEQSSQNIMNMMIKFLINIEFLYRENKLKANLDKYQDYVISTQEEWLNYVNQQINEQIQLIENLQTANNTANRKSQLTIKNVMTYEDLSFWVNFAFVFLLVFIFIFLILYKTGLLEKISKKTTEIVGKIKPASSKTDSGLTFTAPNPTTSVSSPPIPVKSVT